MSHQRPSTRSASYRALALLALMVVAWAASPAPAELAASARPEAQAAPSQPLPPTIHLDAIAAQTAAIHRANGGATVNLFQGDLAGQDLYVVVVYPELSEAVPGPDLDPARVREFIIVHLALLTSPATTSAPGSTTRTATPTSTCPPRCPTARRPSRSASSTTRQPSSTSRA